MAALTNFPWGWGAPWKFICRRVRPRGHSRHCFYAVAFGLLRVSSHTSPRQLLNSSHFLANLSSTFNFEESYSLENGSGNPNEYDTERNEFYEIGMDGSPQPSTEHPPSGRVCTNSLLALNILVYVGQYLSRGKLTLWGTKINSLIDVGQVWRLVTSSFLHGNIVHLLVNCYSLNTIGPTVEKLSGPTRFLAVYMASAIASDTMSYYLTEASSLGASGAIFGLAQKSHDWWSHWTPTFICNCF